jgi:hypothetical protein
MDGFHGIFTGMIRKHILNETEEALRGISKLGDRARFVLQQLLNGVM